MNISIANGHKKEFAEMNRYINYVLMFLCFWFCGVAFAQKNYSNEYQSVPIWSAERENSSTIVGERYVFLDSEKSEMVLAFPENLEKSSLGSTSSNTRRVVRFDLNNQVAAFFATDVKEVGQDFLYSYKVSNARSAKQNINTFLIPVPTNFYSEAISAPNLWAGVFSSSEIYAVKNAIGDDSGKILSWYSLDFDASLIEPGTEMSGFQVTSKLKPGFSLAYVQGGLRPNLTSEIPTRVLEQTVPIMQIENNSQNVVVIAPKHSQDESLSVIAEDFLSGIGRAVELGQIDGQSLTIKETIEFLTGYIQEGRASTRITATPSSQFETDLLHAIKVSLDIQ